MNMKKLHSFALYAMVTPVITFGAGSVLAQQPTDQNIEQQSTPHERDAKPTTGQDIDKEQQTQRARQSDSQTAAKRLNTSDRSGMKNKDYLSAVPANGMHASNLIGAEVKTTGDEEVGPVDDLIIDDEGHLVAIIVGVGGFLGIGEKDVAISWGRVTKSGTADEQELQINVTREELRSAPEYVTLD